MIHRVLMVAEKPSIAEAIATNLCPEGSPNKKTRTVPVYEYRGKFFNQPAEFLVTSTTGHVFATDFHQSYQNWDATDEMTLFDAPIVQKEASHTKITHHLQSCAQGCTAVVLWLDCDREGENICFEVLGIIAKCGIHRPDQIWRAKFSAITKTELTQAFNTLGKPNKNLSDAVECRQELDLKIGVAFTRFQTKTFHGKFGDLDSSVISYGPCQTPTLGFCVKRHDEILNFKPENFWALQPVVANVPQCAKIRFEWNRGRVFDEPMARLLLHKVTENKIGHIVDVRSSNEVKPRPAALNTVELLRVMSRLGISSHSTMHIAEHLYIQGFISYPRTESSAYPASFDFKAVIRDQQRNPAWGKFAEALLEEGISRARGGHDAGDHPPITPMRCAMGPGEVGGSDAWKVYEYVTRHFFASVSGDARYKKTTVVVDLHGERFTTTGRIVEYAGWTEIMDNAAIEDSILPAQLTTANAEVHFSDVKLHAGQTSAPSYLSEADLISEMEKYGIGTDASIPTHIENITKRNYVTVGPGRKMEPTKLGIILARGLSQIDPELVLPLVRSEVEKCMTLIAEGKASKELVLKNSIDLFRRKFEYFRIKIESMTSLMEACYSPLTSTGRFLTRCGDCSRYMRFIETRPQRLYCAYCQKTYNLPNTGTIKKYFDFPCPYDDFELVICHVDQGASTPLCPYCYNNPPFEDYGDKAMTCSMCSHPTCRESLAQTYVCDCVDDGCSGAMAFVVRSSGNWKVCCNKCTMMIKLPGATKKVKVLRSECAECGAHEMKLEFESAEKSPLPGRPLEVIGCLFCNPVLQHAHEEVRGRAFNGRGRGGGGGRGRGRGGGRGRGRGGRGRGRDYD